MIQQSILAFETGLSDTTGEVSKLRCKDVAKFGQSGRIRQEDRCWQMEGSRLLSCMIRKTGIFNNICPQAREGGKTEFERMLTTLAQNSYIKI